MRAYAGYRRVSHVGGRNGEGFHSPDDQGGEIRGWEGRDPQRRVEMLPPELDGKGDDAERPILREAIEGVKAGKFDGVVVAYLSRAGRDLRLMLDLWDELDEAGGEFHSARENVDGTTPSGRLHRNLLASIAQHEREERREGFDAARRGAVEAGIWQRRQTPRGYRKDRRTRKLVPDRQRGSVQAAMRDYLAGTSISQLARRLRMTPSGVRQMLRNRVYLGELRVGQHVNPEAHPFLVDVELFEAVQAKLDSGIRPARGNGVPALLAGLARCASCGHLMSRGTSGGRRVYLCPTRHSGEGCPAPAAVMTAKLDAFVEPLALAELARLEVTASEGNRVERARAKLAAAEHKRDAFLDAFDGAAVDPAAIRRSAEKLQAAVDAAEEALRAEHARAPALPRVGSGADVWDDLNPHERNALLRSLLAAVVVRPAGRGRRVPIAHRVRVFAHGAAVRLPKRRGEEASGIVPIPFPDLDAPGVLGAPAGEDGPKSRGRAV